MSSWIVYCDCDGVFGAILQSCYGVGFVSYPITGISDTTVTASFSPLHLRTGHMFTNIPGECDGVIGDLFHINSRLGWKRN